MTNTRRKGSRECVLGGLSVGVLILTLLLPNRVVAEEIWLADNTRVYGLVTGFRNDAMQITLPGNEIRELELPDIIAISFRGRAPRFVDVGTQEFVFSRGGTLRGQVLGQAGDEFSVNTAANGAIVLDARKMMGLLGLPVAGVAGRRATELLAMEKGPVSPNLDQLLDRRGSRYNGVVQRVDRASVLLDHEDVLRGVSFAWGDVAGIRLADADKRPVPAAPAGAYLRLTLRDGSRFDALLQAVRVGVWQVRPLWDEAAAARSIPVDINEIVSAQVIGGKVQYLSQLPLARTKETQILAPPRGYRLDRNCEGGGLSIGGKSSLTTYPWGIGVHASSELTWDVGQKHKTFCASIGLDGEAGRQGTVVFRVLGDGRELYRSPLLKGGQDPVEISLSIGDVKELTLCVDSGDGNDLGDAANWAAARVLR